MQQKYYVPTFHFDKSKSCYCGSQHTFGKCCAASKETEILPRSIKVVNNFLSDTECKRFIRYAEKQNREWLTVVDSEKSTANKRVLKRHESRVTQSVNINSKLALANEWCMKACEKEIFAMSGIKPQWFEQPQLLRYGPGGKYGMHSDADHFCHETKQFYRFIDRDFSMLIYLNDDYEGGGLYFKGLNFHYQPRKGDLVIFPSSHVFSHESLPLTKGKKYALVSWGAFPGSPRVAAPSKVVRV